MELCTPPLKKTVCISIHGVQVKISQEVLLWFQIDKLHSSHYDSEGCDLSSLMGHADVLPPSARSDVMPPGTQASATGIRTLVSGIVTSDGSLRGVLTLTKQAGTHL